MFVQIMLKVCAEMEQKVFRTDTPLNPNRQTSYSEQTHNIFRTDTQYIPNRHTTAADIQLLYMKKMKKNVIIPTFLRMTLVLFVVYVELYAKA